MISSFLILARVKRLRANEYYSTLKPLKEKFPDQNLDKLASYAKANICIWYQVKRSEEARIISKSGTNFTNDINIVTKKKVHPYNFARLQLDLKALQENIYKSQARKLSKMPLWEAFELNFEISKTELSSYCYLPLSINPQAYKEKNL